MSDDLVTKSPVYSYQLACSDGCGEVLGTTDVPPEKQKPGHHCSACAKARDDAWQKAYRADYDAVVARNYTVDQARTIAASGQWSTLSEGKRAAIKSVIDEASADLLA